jgi:hypothetical protein
MWSAVLVGALVVIISGSSSVYAQQREGEGAIFASMAGHVVIRITERLGGGEPLRTAYAVAEPNQHRAIALFKLRPGHTADERVEAVAELTQSALDSLGLKPGMIKPL